MNEAVIISGPSCVSLDTLLPADYTEYEVYLDLERLDPATIRYADAGAGLVIMYEIDGIPATRGNASRRKINYNVGKICMKLLFGAVEIRQKQHGPPGG